MDITYLKHYSPEKVRALFGLTLGELLTKVLPELLRRRQAAHARRPDRRRAVGGGVPPLLETLSRVVLTRVHLRHTAAHAVIGELCGVSARHC